MWCFNLNFKKSYLKSFFKFLKRLESNFWFISYFPKKQILIRLFLNTKRIFQEKRSIVFNNKPKYLNHFKIKSWNFGSIPNGEITKNTSTKINLPSEINLAGYKYRLDISNNWSLKNIDNISLLQKMNLHYMNFLKNLNEPYGSKVILNWISQVKPYSKNYWSYSWNSYSLSIRVINWIDYLSKNAKYIENNDLFTIQKSILNQIIFLKFNLETDIRGNHLMKNIRCLFRSVSLVMNKEAQSWLIIASNLLDKELDHQIMDDGMHFELSHSYHIQVLQDLLCIRRSLIHIIKVNKLEYKNEILLKKIEKNIKKMFYPLSFMTHPDGKASLLGDSGLTTSESPRKIISYLKKNKILDHIEIQDFIYWKLNNAGYYGYKSKNSSFIIDCGPTCPDDLPAHGQGDSLSFEWSIQKERFIVDTGVYEYKQGRKRSYSRSTFSHNTLTLDNLNQSQFWSSFRTGKRAKSFLNYFKSSKRGFTFEGYHDGYKNLKGNPLILRKIKFKPSQLKVQDRVTSQKKHKITSRILFSNRVFFEDKFINKKGQYCCYLILKSSFKNKNDINMFFESDVDFKIIPAFWYPDFGVSIKTSRLVMSLDPDSREANWIIRTLDFNN